MISFGWVKRFSDKAQQVAECLRFFSVASVSVWREKWTQSLAAFRTQEVLDKHKGAIAAWIRQCEYHAQCFDCQPYDALKFKDSLLEARKLTNEENTEILIEKLEKLCADAGVILAVVPAPKGSPVCCMRWTNMWYHCDLTRKFKK